MNGLNGNLLPLGIFLAAFGCLIVIVELVQLFRSVAASHWPSINGEIESEGVAEGYDANGVFGTRRVIFRPVIRYEYRLADGVHHGERLGFGGLVSSSLTAARRTAARYEGQKTVKVYYSPRNPTEAVIEVGVRFSHCVGLAIGAACMALGIVLLLTHFGATL